MAGLYFVTGFLLILLTGVTGKTCSSYYYIDIECYTGCCGSYYSTTSRYCCGSSSGSSSYTSTINTYVNIPLIVGLSVSGFFFIVIVIAVICACVKSANRPGRVIGVQTVRPTVVSTTATSSQQGGYTGQIPQPPAYNAYPQPGPPSALYPPPGPPSAVYPPPGPQPVMHPPPAPLQNFQPPTATHP